MKLFDKLKEAGAVASGTLHPRGITLPNGETWTVFVREIPEGEIRSIFAKSEDPHMNARLIRAAIRNEDGSPFATVDEIESLLPAYVRALERPMREVNFPVDGELESLRKNSESEATSGSGSSSPDTSDEPSAS